MEKIKVRKERQGYEKLLRRRKLEPVDQHPSMHHIGKSLDDFFNLARHEEKLIL
jgi:hypothetical protein